MPEPVTYERSLKSRQSDELINTYLLRPIAGLLVTIVSRTPITPNHLTLLSIIAGLGAASLYARGDPTVLPLAGLAVTTKDLLDSADGQLARAKSLFSRSGRFLDSIGDFVVNLAVFSAIGWHLYRESQDLAGMVLAIAGLAGITLRVSYHVFYQVSFLHGEGIYGGNRLTEEMTEADRRGPRLTLALQKVFLGIYGWQDRLMLRIDRWCRGSIRDPDGLARWYGDGAGLRISGLLGIGTELFLLTLFSILKELDLYLWANIVGMNGILIVSITYRRRVLRRRLAFTRTR
ncbi:MAG: CDP-alcohol phosphatidyltransferase family protein [Ignavibacteria bacterium]|nr:CDP-alcohol phosphatidyltransferase family protein [Ignavibacteria bacterium]